MEYSEVSTQVIDLGKQFVKELGLERSVDTLSRWLAHYLAEQITRAEQSEGLEKKAAEKECAETILELWNHRWCIPKHARPFGNFEQLFQILERLNPDNESSFFFDDRYYDDLEEKPEESSEGENELEKWVATAKQIDRVARIWLNFVLTQAAKSAVTSDLKNWLEHSVMLPLSHDREIISNLIQFSSDKNEDENSESSEPFNDEGKFERKTEFARIKMRIYELEQFSKLNEELIKVYKSQLPTEN